MSASPLKKSQIQKTSLSAWFVNPNKQRVKVYRNLTNIAQKFQLILTYTEINYLLVS